MELFIALAFRILVLRSMHQRGNGDGVGAAFTFAIFFTKLFSRPLFHPLHILAVCARFQAIGTDGLVSGAAFFEFVASRAVEKTMGRQFVVAQQMFRLLAGGRVDAEFRRDHAVADVSVVVEVHRRTHGHF